MANAKGALDDVNTITGEISGQDGITASLAKNAALTASVDLAEVYVTNDYSSLRNIPTINGERMVGELTAAQQDIKATRATQARKAKKAQMVRTVLVLPSPPTAPKRA